MAVSVSFRGRIQALERQDDLLGWAETFAKDMEWSFHPLEIGPRPALLGTLKLEAAKAAGAVLVPHFACDPLPLMVIEGQGHLVDSYAHQDEAERIEFSPEPILNTLFAGPGTHREIVEMLEVLRDRFVPDLVVDDETGDFEARDDDALGSLFASSWEALAENVKERRGENAAFELGSMIFEPLSGNGPSSDGEFSLIQDEERQLLEALTQEIRAGYGGLGLELTMTDAGVENLDLLMLESDQEGWGSQPKNPETERFAHGLGAVFGQALIAILGGRWRRDGENMIIEDVGASGLRVDPFQIAAERLILGPPHGFGLHLQLFRNAIRHFPRIT